jgi:hypothetical protein
MAKKKKFATHAGLVRAGLSREEIRLIGGFRGLSESQRQLMLETQALHVLARARAASNARDSIERLFKFIPLGLDPQKLVDGLATDDEFVAELQSVTARILQADLPNFDVARLQTQVNAIDDSSQIEVAAFKAGFLSGAEYRKRQRRVRDE